MSMSAGAGVVVMVMLMIMLVPAVAGIVPVVMFVITGTGVPVMAVRFVPAVTVLFMGVRAAAVFVLVFHGGPPYFSLAN